ncbi:MAG: hypothetical protein DIU56_014660 [Pseudomonadota bacterium]|jgi:hypothetical protein
MARPFLFQARVCVLAAAMAVQSAAAAESETQVASAAPPPKTAPRHDYPTVARVEYVHECMVENGGEIALLYKCSCVIDRIAESLSYDEFVEAQSFARYSTLAGERGGVFRDTDEARKKARTFTDLEAAAQRSCGIESAAGGTKR